ncbi:MAG: hypothetical protein IJV78_05325 [Clostridia bacterium]|nr:hypothetical protein [Clostridia bacterium]
MLSKNQKDEIIKMYAELISTQDSGYERLKALEKLRDSFASLIPDWSKLISEYAIQHGLTSVLSTIALLESKPEDKPEEAQRDIIDAGVARKCKYGFYTTKTDEQIDADIQDLNNRIISYTTIMTVVDEMYDREIITLEDYYKAQELMGDKYGITQKSLFWWNGPRKIEHKPRKPLKPARPYIKRDTEYWDKYKK